MKHLKKSCLCSFCIGQKRRAHRPRTRRTATVKQVISSIRELGYQHIEPSNFGIDKSVAELKHEYLDELNEQTAMENIQTFVDFLVYLHC